MCRINVNVLKEAREERGLSQKELSNELGLNKWYISNIEKQGSCNDEVASKIATFFHIPEEKLRDRSSSVMKRKGVRTNFRKISPEQLNAIIKGKAKENGYGEKQIESEIARIEAGAGVSIINGKKYYALSPLCCEIAKWQRHTNMMSVRYIMDNYNKNKLDPIKVVIHDGQIFCVDGNHRLLAHVLSDKPVINAEILEMTITEAKQLFLEQTLGIRMMSQEDKWRASLELEYRDAMALSTICKEANIQIKVDPVKLENPVGNMPLSQRLMLFAGTNPGLLRKIIFKIKELGWTGSDKGNVFCWRNISVLRKLYSNFSELEVDSMLKSRLNGVVAYDKYIATERSSEKMFDLLSQFVREENALVPLF